MYSASRHVETWLSAPTGAPRRRVPHPCAARVGDHDCPHRDSRYPTSDAKSASDMGRPGLVAPSTKKHVILLLLAALLGPGSLSFAQSATLRVCADPNNLPFSNDREQGFENRLADMVAKDLGMKVSYDWYPQREKFFDKTLNAGACDVVMGVPSGMQDASTTQPYYRSSYAFVSRHDSHLNIHSFDDPRLRHLRVGVHVTGEGDATSPPAAELATRGIVHNLVGYNIYGNLSEKNPPADLIQAVVNKDVDVAIAWGPMAGYFAKHAAVPLDITPVSPRSGFAAGLCHFHGREARR